MLFTFNKRFNDKNIERILKNAGYTSGHDHSQVDALNSYAKRTTGSRWTPAYGENWAGSYNFRHTAQSLLNGWKNSPGHNDAILDRKGPKWVAMTLISLIN